MLDFSQYNLDKPDYVTFFTGHVDILDQKKSSINDLTVIILSAQNFHIMLHAYDATWDLCEVASSLLIQKDCNAKLSGFVFLGS